MSISITLMEIQKELKAPKGQFNRFGNYKYRSCEDIIEAVKPLAAKHKCAVVISDDILEVGGRIYVKATAALVSDSERIETTGFARESETRKGMDDSQITGSASSYARKYALNGLFAIDDTKDADATNNHDENQAVKIDAKTKKEVFEQSLSCLENGDDNGLKEIWSEFGSDEKAVLWGMFNSQQRAAMKELMK